MSDTLERSRVSAIAVCCSTGAVGILELVERFLEEAADVPEPLPFDDLATDVVELALRRGAEESDRDWVVGIRMSGTLVGLVLELADLVEGLLCVLFLDTPSGLSVIPVECPRFGVTDSLDGCTLERLDTELEVFRLGAEEFTWGGGVAGRVRE